MHSNPFVHSVPFRFPSASATCRFGAAFVIAVLFATGPIQAGDWPQILGPNRDGQVDSTIPLKTNWPSTLKPVWVQELGSGYAGAAIVKNVVYIPHRLGDQELLEALDLATGKQLWRASWPASYSSSIDADSGPRCVPTIAGEQAICYGAAGDLVSVRLADGKLNWSRPLRRELDADDGYFGAGTAPLVVGDIVVVGVGASTAGIVGVDLKSGKTLWKATNYDASYAAPIELNQVGKSGKPLALVVTRLNTVVLDTGDGKVVSDVKFGSRGPTVNAATPIEFAPNKYLLTASYGIGALSINITDGKATEIYRDGQLLSSQYNTPVKIGNRVIGINGREDSAPGSLRALDPTKKEIIWDKPGVGTAHLIATGNQVLLVSVKGSVLLIDGSADSPKILAEAKVAGTAFRSLPALAGDLLIVRDSVDGISSRCVAIRLAGN